MIKLSVQTVINKDIKLSRQASVIDYPKDHLDPLVWKSNNTIQELVTQEILLGLDQSAIPYKEEVYVVGSICTHRWREDSDIDVTVVLDLSEDKMRELTKEILKINGENKIAEHPINYYLRKDLSPTNYSAIYDLINDKWIKEEDPNLADVEDVVDKVRSWARRIAGDTQELRMDLIDFKVLKKDLTERGVDQDKLREAVEDKIEQVKGDISLLTSEYDEIHLQRKNEFEKDLKEGSLTSREFLPGNLIYKYLERYGLIDLLASIKKVNKKLEITGIKLSRQAADSSFVLLYIDKQDSIYSKIKDIAKKIRKEDLANDGREDNLHISLKGGLDTEDPDVLEPFLDEEGKIKVKIEKLDCFDAKETKQGFDVVILKVNSDQIQELHDNITDALKDSKEMYDNYRPHITLAYVKKGLGKQYVKELKEYAEDLIGKEIIFKKATFSTPEEKKTEIKLSMRKAQQTLNTIICQTSEEKALGLQGVTNLPNDTVLLFESVQGDVFHMRNCLFPISWICLSDEGIILAKKELQPENDIASVVPNTVFVLETKPDTFSTFREGDRIDLDSLQSSGKSVFDLQRN